MAKMQVYLLAAVMLCSVAVQVYGRVGPHNIERKPVSLPQPVKDGLNKPGKFAKHEDDLHATQNGRGRANGHTDGYAFGERVGHTTHTQGVANITLNSNGKGNGDASIRGDSGSFVKFGHARSGAVVDGVSKSDEDGKGRLKTGDAIGIAQDGKNTDRTFADVELDSRSNGVRHGSSTNKGNGFAGGKVKGATVSGLKGSTRDHATNKATADSDVKGTTYAENKNNKDTVVAHGQTDSISRGFNRNHVDANGKGELHGGSKADKAFATVEVKGTSKVENKFTKAEGEGIANADSIDRKNGKKESYADSSANAFGREISNNGGAKATGKGIGHTGVEHSTEAFSKTDTSVNTGSTRPEGKDDGKAWAGGKHFASLKGSHGSVTAGGGANVHVGHGFGNSTAHGSAHSEKRG